MEKCEICRAEFVPNRSANQKLCGARACKAENKRRVRAKREGLKLTDRTPRPCVVCGELFVPHQSNQTACPKFECKIARRKIAAVRRYRAQQRAATETCGICRRKFVPKFGGQKTCGNSRCVSALRIQNTPKETKSCRFCRAKFTIRLNSGREFCSDECRKHWKNEQMLMAQAEQVACPFPTMQTGVPGLGSWDCPEMDPMSCGTARVMLKFEVSEERRKAA